MQRVRNSRRLNIFQLKIRITYRNSRKGSELRETGRQVAHNKTNLLFTKFENRTAEKGNKRLKRKDYF